MTSTQSKIKQQADELAVKCTRLLHNSPDNEMYYSQCEQVVENIFRELNLESLIADKLCIDYMDKQNHFESVGNFLFTRTSDSPIRKAILSAIESEEKK